MKVGRGLYLMHFISFIIHSLMACGSKALYFIEKFRVV